MSDYDDKLDPRSDGFDQDLTNFNRLYEIAGRVQDAFDRFVVSGSNASAMQLGYEIRMLTERLANPHYGPTNLR